jgi:quercetin dioxygenase-like cupin family protein
MPMTPGEHAVAGLERVTACFGPLIGPTRSTDVVYAVHGGDRVTIMIDATETGGAFDVVEVLAQPGGATPPHRHAFAEWFHVLDGAVQFQTASCGALKPTAIVEQGGTYVVPPWTPHALQNTTATPVRFLLAGQPGVMSSYFANAGVRIRDAQSRPSVPPPSPSALAKLTARHGIQPLDKRTLAK